MNIACALRRSALEAPEKIAVRHGDVELTYRDLAAQSAAFAGFLRQRGIGPGDRVGILMHNEPEWLTAMVGIWMVGAVVVPFNYMAHPAAIRHVTVDADVKVIVTPANDVARLLEGVVGLPVEASVVSVGEAEGAAFVWSEALANADPVADVAPRLDSDDAILMYTSGSTGSPKGVRQTHRNSTAIVEAEIDMWSLTAADHALVCTPLFHVGGLQLIALPILMVGGTVTLRRWKVAEYLADVQRLQPTFTALVAAMMIDIVHELDGHPMPLPSIRVCAIGGSALPQSRLRQLTELTGIVPVNIYGQTEQMGVSITEPINEARREGSLGKPMRHIVDTRVVVPDSSPPVDVEVGEVGELWVRGDAVTPGYWQLPATNAEKFVDGWLRTSDLVRFDEDGFVFYVDRTDDMIISGGENVFPQMVEGFLAACPLVAEVAVIGTPHERLSSQVTAIIVPTTTGVRVEDIVAYCDSDPNLRGLQRPRRIEIVQEIPRTATNKIDRPQLKKQFA